MASTLFSSSSPTTPCLSGHPPQAAEACHSSDQFPCAFHAGVSHMLKGPRRKFIPKEGCDVTTTIPSRQVNSLSHVDKQLHVGSSRQCHKNPSVHSICQFVPQGKRHSRFSVIQIVIATAKEQAGAEFSNRIKYIHHQY